MIVVNAIFISMIINTKKANIMKKFYTVLLLALLGSASFAQVTINSENYYKPGSTVRDVYSVENDATDSVLMSNVFQQGELVQTALTQVFPNYGMIDTVVYSEPRTEGNFTESTCSFSDENGMRMHINVTNEKATCLGISGALSQFGLNDDMEIAFDEPMDIATFPIQQNTLTQSNAHGEYREHISALEATFSSFDATFGPMIYSMLAEQYDSILTDIQVAFSSNFDSEESIVMNGESMLSGTFLALRELRQYTYTTNMLMHPVNGTEFLNINECTLNVTNALLALYLGSSINIGEELSSMMGLTFPIENTTATINYWVADDNYPIIEMTTNENHTGVMRLAIRYEDNHEVEIETIEINASLYPNPASDIINIAIDGMDNGKIMIYSANGSLVSEKALNGNFNSINVSSLSSGNYLYTITSGDKKINGKFAKN